jgi:recombinational DNA repair protein (RecF pathway)
MYHKYSTEGFVVHRFDVAEGDSVLDIYTQEFGMIRARARSVRLETSKLRYQSRIASLVRVELVRGKNEWKLTGAQQQALLTEPLHVHAFMRVAKLLRTLIQGEEKHTYLFAALMQLFMNMHKGRVVAEEELLGVARTLYALGYMAPEADVRHVFEFEPLLEERHTKKVQALVNTSLRLLNV